MEKLFKTCNVYLAQEDFTHLKTIQQNAKNVLKMPSAKEKIQRLSNQDTGDGPFKVKKYSLVSDLNHVWVE